MFCCFMSLTIGAKNTTIFSLYRKLKDTKFLNEKDNIVLVVNNLNLKTYLTKDI